MSIDQKRIGLSNALSKTWCIILYTDHYDRLRRLLNALDVPPSQTIIVHLRDDDPIKQLCHYHGLHYLRAPENIALAYNQGIKLAETHGAQFVCLIKNEIDITSSLISQLLWVYFHEENIGAVAPTQLYTTSQNCQTVYSKKWSLSQGTLRPIVTKPNGPPIILEADYFDLNCVLFSTALFQKIGFFNPDYKESPHLDFSYRLWLQGFRIVYQQTAQIFCAPEINIHESFNEKEQFRHEHLNHGVNFLKNNATWHSWATIEHHLHEYLDRYGLLSTDFPILKLGHPVEKLPYLFTVWETTQWPSELREGIHQYAQIFVPSRWNVDIIKNAGNKNVSFVPLGLEPDVYHPWGPAYPFKKEKVFLVVCHDQYRKAIDVSIKAWLATIPRMPGAWLYFFGRNIKLNRYLKKQCDQWQIYDDLKIEVFEKEKIICLAPLRHFTYDEIAAFYRGADVLLMNSRSEGFGFPIIEAMACNTLTIVPNYGAAAEFINGENCIALEGHIHAADYSEFNYHDVGNWWEPDIEKLKNCLVEAYQLSSGAHAQMTKSARQFVLKNYSWRRSMMAFRDTLSSFQPQQSRQHIAAPLVIKTKVHTSVVANKIKKMGARVIQYAELLETNPAWLTHLKAFRFLARKSAKMMTSPIKSLSEYLRQQYLSLMKDQLSLEEQFLMGLTLNDKGQYAHRNRWYSDDRPLVSIIILNYNKSHLTIRCIKEIWRHTFSAPYEIIVLDNGSSDEDYHHLSNIDKRYCHFIRLTINRYFPEGCNIAAEYAKGEYLFFLNNDAFVTENWLAPLLTVLETRNDIGTVCPMLVNIDGSIQAAGCKLEQEFAILIGSNENVENPQYNQETEVDFSCGAACLVRKTDFDRVGGYDYFWNMGYYEDVDLSFKIKKTNKKNLYIPQSKIFHIKNATAHTYRHWAYASSEINRHKFFYRWGEVPATFSEGTFKSLKEFDHPPTHRQKTIGFHVPYPLKINGYQKYLFTLVAYLSFYHKVILFFPEKYSLYALNSCMKLFGLNFLNVTIEKDLDLNSFTLDLFVSLKGREKSSRPNRDKHFLLHWNKVNDDDIEHLSHYHGIMVESERSKIDISNQLTARALKTPPIYVIDVPGAKLNDMQGDNEKNSQIVHIISIAAFSNQTYLELSARIHTFNQLYKNNKSLVLHLIGDLVDLDCLDGLKKWAESLPLYFHLNPSFETLQGLYRKAHIYWQIPNRSTTKDFNLNLPLLEAMSYGCVPIACNHEAHDYVVHHQEGFFYSSEQELIDYSSHLIEEHAIREKYARGAIQKAFSFTEENFINKAFAAMGLTL